MKDQAIIVNNAPTVSFTSYSTNDQLIEKYNILRPETEILDLLSLSTNGMFEDKKYVINENKEVIVDAYTQGLCIRIIQNKLEQENTDVINMEVSIIIKNTGEVYYVVDSYIENTIEQRPNDIYYSMDGKLTPRSDILIGTIGNKLEINKLKTRLQEIPKFNIMGINKTKRALALAEKEGNYSLMMGYNNLKNVVEQKFGIIDKEETKTENNTTTEEVQKEQN